MYKIFFISLFILLFASKGVAQDSLFYATGELKGHGALVNKVKEGQWKFYFPNGTQSSIFTYKSGDLEGEQLYFDEFGRLQTREYWRDGMRVDTLYRYHPSGQLWGQGSFKDGVYSGEWIYYYESGQIEHTLMYKEGYPDADWKAYHQNGNLFQRGHYENGKQHGLWEFFDEDGNKTYEGNYAAGEQTGQWYRFTKDGEKKEWKRFH